MGRLLGRLGLSQYNVEAPLKDELAQTTRVKIYLNQHIGAPSVPVVRKQDRVKKGEVIAVGAEGKLSVPVHASMDGEVLEVTERFILLKA
jgi:Na+-translocating ferredoxin:NAD+ oxidoreductase RnfC subunit